MKKHFDIIICGGGCAGLSLVRSLIQAQLPYNVLVLEKQQEQLPNKTWCFWHPDNFGYNCARQVAWQNLVFKTERVTKTQRIDPLVYHHIDAAHFNEEVKALIATAPNVHLAYEAVQNIQQGTGQAQVQTQDHTYTAQWVFDSRPVRPPAKPGQYHLLQHFVGWTIETTEPMFDPTECTLMDFSVPQEHGAEFFYVLPFSPTKALVEYTLFSPSTLPGPRYQKALEAYIGQQIGAKHYTVVQKEQGVIPMTNYPFKYYASPNVFKIGTAGGFTKPTTGYTFRQCQLKAQAIAHSFAQTGKPPLHFKTKARYHFYDQLLLNLIEQEPQQIKPIFQALFKNNSFKNILTFLDEEASFFTDISIFLKIPWPPFLRALYRHYLAPAPKPLAPASNPNIA